MTDYNWLICNWTPKILYGWQADWILEDQAERIKTSVTLERKLDYAGKNTVGVFSEPELGSSLVGALRGCKV